jgi:hypothetical protein
LIIENMMIYTLGSSISAMPAILFEKEFKGAGDG